MKIPSILVLSVAGLLAAASVAAHRSQMGQAAAAKGLQAEGVVDANGNLRVPAGYRTSYQFLGSWAMAADKGQGSQGLHVVYASPGASESSQRFADSH